MGLKDSLVSMMGDFVELRRNPDFRSKTELAASAAGDSDLPDPLQYNPNRRHSLQITCGTQDSQPEMLVHQRTFSISSNKKQPKQHRSSKQKTDGSGDSGADCASLRQEPLYSRRYKQRRASEPVNLLGIGLWAKGVGQNKQQKQSSDAPTESPAHSASPPPIPASPSSSSAGGGREGRSPAHSFSKSGAFAARFFAQQNRIEEAEELEALAEIDAGQRRQSQGGKKRPSLSNLVDQTPQQGQQQPQRFTTVIRL